MGAWVPTVFIRAKGIDDEHAEHADLGLASGNTDPIDGFDVEAADGSIGKIDEATYEVAGSYIVVDTGPWIFGKKVLLPAGVVDQVDYDDETVYVGLTKDQIKNSPSSTRRPIVTMPTAPR